MIIFLNVCSSAGKTSIARAIQHLSSRPQLRVVVDMFINMMPDKYIEEVTNLYEGYVD